MHYIPRRVVALSQGCSTILPAHPAVPFTRNDYLIIFSFLSLFFLRIYVSSKLIINEDISRNRPRKQEKVKLTAKSKKKKKRLQGLAHARFRRQKHARPILALRPNTRFRSIPIKRGKKKRTYRTAALHSPVPSPSQVGPAGVLVSKTYYEVNSTYLRKIVEDL